MQFPFRRTPNVDQAWLNKPLSLLRIIVIDLVQGAMTRFELCQPPDRKPSPQWFPTTPQSHHLSCDCCLLDLGRIGATQKSFLTLAVSTGHPRPHCYGPFSSSHAELSVPVGPVRSSTTSAQCCQFASGQATSTVHSSGCHVNRKDPRQSPIETECDSDEYVPPT